MTGSFTAFRVAGGPNDDSSSGPVSLPFAANFFGTTYNNLFVNNNGNVTFNSALGTFTPFGLQGGPSGYHGQPIIAAFFADVDTRGSGSGLATYGTGTYNGHTAFGVDYLNVGYYSGQTNHLNTFEIILTDRSDTGVGNFDIYFNYNSITWETGSASGGSGGFGGTPAAAGYSSGGANPTFFQFPGSLVTRALVDGGPNALASNTNDGVNGQYLFQVRSGLVTGGGPPPPPPPPPEPLHAVSFALEYVPLLHEGDTGVTPFDFTIVRSGDLDSPTEVHWEIITTDPSDFAPDQPLSGDVVFGPGQTRIVVPISVQGDRRFEEDDSFRFALTRAVHGTVAFNPDVSVMDFIINDDPATTFDFAGPLMRLEGQVGTTPFEFVVVRSGDLRQGSEVQWRLETGTANAADFADSQALTGVVTFAPGSAQAVISIEARGDTRLEPDENFTVRLTSARTGTIVTQLDIATTGTILDDDTRQTLLVAGSGSLVLLEGDAGTTAFNFDILRVGDLSLAAQIPYTVQLPAGGATAADFQGPLSGVISFAAGASTATLTVLVVGDNIAEPNETFSVMLGGGDGYNSQVVNGVIINDDKVAAAAAASDPPSPAADNVSLFLQQLTGGGLWSDFGGL